MGRAPLVGGHRFVLGLNSVDMFQDPYGDNKQRQLPRRRQVRNHYMLKKARGGVRRLQEGQRDHLAAVSFLCSWASRGGIPPMYRLQVPSRRAGQLFSAKTCTCLQHNPAGSNSSQQSGAWKLRGTLGSKSSTPRLDSQHVQLAPTKDYYFIGTHVLVAAAIHSKFENAYVAV